MGQIWLIGGTQESARIARLLAQADIPALVTVTTPTAVNLYPPSPCLEVLVGKLDSSQIGQFLSQYQIVAVVDASHPYAVAISQTAIAATKAHNIPYLRYERPAITSQIDRVIELESFPALLTGNYLQNQRVMLTVGYQALPLFQPWQERATLFARILPNVESLKVALNAGFPPDRLIALRPPLSLELEQALWQHWQISLVVTKASGTAGGEDLKRTLAAQLNIPLIVIKRPQLDYPQQTSDLAAVLSFCRLYI